jgi:hypothetical protein
VLLGLFWQGMKFLPENAMAMTTVYILVVPIMSIPLRTFLTPLFPHHWSPSCTCHGGVGKGRVVLPGDFVFTNSVILITYFHSRMDFYCVKLILSLQCFLLIRNVFK